MSFEHRVEQQQPGTASTAAPATAPGKRTKTEGIQSTGVPFVDDGTACERDDRAGKACFLTEVQRTRLVAAIGNRAGIVGANSRDALQDSRIDELTDKPEGWHALAEFMFYSVTGPIIGMVASRIVNEAMKENVKALMINVSRAQRKTLMNAANAPAPGKASKVRFLELCRDAIGPWQAAMSEDAPRDLDDDGLTALKDALDPGTLTVDFFKGRIADMLSRFDKQQIDQVGVEAIYKHGELVYIGRGNRRRLVMLEDFGLHNTVATALDAPKPRDLVQKMDHGGKPIIIDPDLEPMALAFYAERTGRTPMHMDVEAAVAIGGAFASNFLDDLLSMGAAP